MRARRVLHWVILPGIVLHEIAHALVIALTPNVTITDLDLTSHVEHKGHYTLLNSTLISYAPLVVNTAVAFWALTTAATLQLNSTQHIAAAAILYYLAFVAGMTAIPSWQDITNPINLALSNLFTISGILLSPFIVVLLLLSIPWLLIAYARENSFTLYVVASLLYATAVILIGLGIIPIPSVDAIIQAVQQLVEPLLNR